MTQYDKKELLSSTGSSFRVLGIAMVVEQLGKGPRMILRYPTVLPTTMQGGDNSSNTSSIRSSLSGSINRSSDNGTDTLRGSVSSSSSTIAGSSSRSHNTKSKSLHNKNKNNGDLFHRLSGRQMAKLFRPKRALCGQPITLTIDDTYFCCCSVLLDPTTTTTLSSDANSSPNNPTSKPSDDEQKVDDVNNHERNIISGAEESQYTSNDQPLVLFSVIVAVASSHNCTITSSSPSKTISRSEMSYNNPIFPAIRRIHISLSRLCRILEREERRCRYVSCQVTLCEQIRSNLTSSILTSSSEEASSPSPSKSSKSATEQAAEPLTSSSTMPVLSKETISDVGSSSSTQGVTTNKIPSLGGATNNNNNNNNTPSVSAASSPISNTNNNKSLSHSTTTITSSTAVGSSHRRTGSFSFTSSDIHSSLATPLTNIATSGTAPTTVTTTIDPILSNQLQSQSSSTIKDLSDFEMAIQQHELEQVILETIMTAPPTRIMMPNDVEIIHAGNLVQELVLVYHALARRTDCGEGSITATAVMITPPTSILTGQDSVVYVNGHIAVTIEAAASLSSNTPLRTPIFDQQQKQQQQKQQQPIQSDTINSNTAIRPYMTLLFPRVGPDQILQSFEQQGALSYGTTQQTPRRIQQLLRVYSPQKSLSEMSKETFIPIQVTLEIVSQLVRQGLCMISPLILSYETRFVPCNDIQRIHQMTLPFYQTFGRPINLFVLISYITESNRTMGMCISQLLQKSLTSNQDNSIIALLQESMFPEFSNNNDIVSGTDNDDIERIRKQQEHDHQEDKKKEIIYEMIVWLCSHQVIVPLQDYFVVIRPSGGDDTVSTPTIAAVSETSTTTGRQPAWTNPYSSSSSNATTNNSNKLSMAVISPSIKEERKYEDPMTTATTSTSIQNRMWTKDVNRGSFWNDTTTGNDTNSNIMDDDVYIWQQILVPYLYERRRTRATSNDDDMDNKGCDNSNSSSIMECCYVTGIEESILRSFLLRNPTIVRIVQRPTLPFVF